MDAAPAAAPTPFADPALEAEYQAARARFAKPPAAQSGGLWLLASIAVFAVAQLAEDHDVAKLVILVVVLLFHELGHYVGMVGFGYRDVRMFFIPLFGAAVSGRPGRASQTREAIVLLLGPVPGIVFGLSAAVAAVITREPHVRTLALYLLALNALNLLPIMPLDGGRLASVLLFSRWAFTEKLFALVTGGLVALWAFTHGLPFLGAFGVLMVLGAGHRSRMLALAARVRGEAPALVNDPAALDEREVRALYTAVAEAWPASSPRRATVMGDWMTQVLELASRRPPSVGRTLALSAVWAFALLLAVVGLGIAAAAKGV